MSEPIIIESLQCGKNCLSAMDGEMKNRLRVHLLNLLSEGSRQKRDMLVYFMVIGVVKTE